MGVCILNINGIIRFQRLLLRFFAAIPKSFQVLICINLFVSSIHAQEIHVPLNNGWSFRKVGSNENWQKALIPGTIHTDLMATGRISDPFLGCNNLNLSWIDEADWEYMLNVKLDESQLKNKHLDLIFEGLDTYADVYVNNKIALRADNMFRKWIVNCESLLKVGKNSIRIVFNSALNEVKRKSKEIPYLLPGGEWAWVRKSPYHFGWDWGPRFITCGIWKPVYLRTWSDFRITDIQINQDKVSTKRADLTAIVSIESASHQEVDIYVNNGDNGLVRTKQQLEVGINPIKIPFKINNPKLWWSNGAGKPYLYSFDFNIEGKTQSQKRSVSYGIRTLDLVQEKDSIGKSFFFKLNGTPIFMKGANIIPRHSFLPSTSNEKMKELLTDAANSGINMLRIWGGGTYEEDHFYSLCDSLGILIWQDFMFAGSMYPGDSSFLANVKEEVNQQVIRLRNHPCIALWCGNNEVDEAWNNWGWQKQYNMSKSDSTKIWSDYAKLFHQLIPEVLVKNDPLRPYWASSPKNGWGRAKSMTEGDSHYWGVWWGLEPFSTYKRKIPRFMSEYGFQGYPDARTVQQFSNDGKSSPDSAELLCHQKHSVGYQTIDKHIQREGLRASSLEQEIYLSQIVQCIGYRTAIESHRLAKPHCMGTLYWQLNDCWPVVSWSSIDFNNRWKAVHYTIRDAYKQILLATKIDKNGIVVNAVSDYLTPVKGTLKTKIFDIQGSVIKEWRQKITIKPNSSEPIQSIPYEFSKSDSSKLFVVTEFVTKSGERFNSYTFNCNPGSLKLLNPEIAFREESSEDGNYIILTCKHPVLYVQLSSLAAEFKVNDNYFNMLPGINYRVKLINGDFNKITAKSLFDFL